jgi:hypothetical protein
MSQEQESLITFLNRCATSVRSVMVDLFGEAAVNPRDGF